MAPLAGIVAADIYLAVGIDRSTGESCLLSKASAMAGQIDRHTERRSRL
jgi:hypothetical protein